MIGFRWKMSRRYGHVKLHVVALQNTALERISIDSRRIRNVRPSHEKVHCIRVKFGSKHGRG